MAGDTRGPGDVSVKYRSRPVNYAYLQKINNPGIAKTGSLGPGTTISEYCFKSTRPSYSKGAVVTLPGGVSFRKSTAYSHESVEVIPNGTYECGYWSRRDNLAWIYCAARDQGRETGWLVLTDYRSAPAGIPADARNEAVTKALTKIADQKVGLGENLLTLGQTVRMLTDKSSLMLSLIRSARSRRSWQQFMNKTIHDIRRAGPLSTAAREYLTYIYGFKPLMSDIYALAEMAKKQANETLLLRASASAMRSSRCKPRKLGPFSYSEMSILGGSYTQRVKCTIWARIDPNAQHVRALNQLGLLNPAGVAWDLVPFSFVVDWFCPIGPVLYAMTAPAGLLFVDGSISCRTSETAIVSFKTDTTAVSYTKSSLPPKYERPMTLNRNLESYVRQTLATWPQPGLWLDPDPFRVDRPLKALALGIIGLRSSR